MPSKNKISISSSPGSSLKNKTRSWRTFKPIFSHDKCTACGICERVCPEGIIYPSGETNTNGKIYREADYNYCKGCGICAHECPFKAIKMEKE